MPMTMMMMVFGCQLQLVVEVARVMQSAAAVALQPRTIIIMPPTVSIDSRLECGSDGAVALSRDRSSTRGADTIHSDTCNSSM